MYNKLFTKILDSTIWLESDATRLVWITMLAAMDEDGFVAITSVGNVAARARVTEDAAEVAIKALEGPDRHGRDQEHEGRRIERVPYGWMVLNAEKYRDMVRRDNAREATRERVARHRARNAGVTAGNADVTKSTPSVSEAVSDTGKEKIGAARPTEHKGKRLDVHSLPDDWRNFCKHERPKLDPDKTFYQFRDHWMANANRPTAKKSDWFAAWRTWIRRERA